MKIRALALAVSALLVVGSTQPALAQDNEVDSKDTWDLSQIYPTQAAWTEAKDRLTARLPDIDECEGKLGEGSETLLSCSELLSDIFMNFARISSYAGMNADGNTQDGDAQALRGQAQLLGSQLGQKTAFLSPEILSVGKERIDAMLAEEPRLAPYALNFDNTLRLADHTLSAKEEQLMASTSLLQQSPNNTYRTLANADLPWPTITLADGSEARLDQAGYGRYRALDNRPDRKAVFDNFWQIWGDYKRTFGTTLNGQVQANLFRANVRNYPNAMAAALAANNIPEEVYRTLIREVNGNLDTLHRYFRLRARMLDINDLGYHDIYPSLVSLDKDFSLDVGKQLTLDSAAPLGEDYVKAIEHGFNNRWMDAYPRPGKRSGAYMNPGAYEVHPYVLMNYTDDYSSVSTLAHEWGHAMHSYLAQKAQPFVTANYSIFTAEIASTFNEALLLEHMLKQTESDEERLFYLGSALEQLRGTFYRQAMFAEYELKIHEAAQEGQSLTGDSLTAMYAELLKRYHGHDEGVMTIDDSVTAEWAYIPHFYFNFYVYQYATSLAASSLLAETVLEGQPGAVDNYLNLLKAGGSDYAYDLLKNAGVDMATPEPYRAVVLRMNRIMDEIEAILDSQV